MQVAIVSLLHTFPRGLCELQIGPEDKEEIPATHTHC